MQCPMAESLDNKKRWDASEEGMGAQAQASMPRRSLQHASRTVRGHRVDLVALGDLEVVVLSDPLDRVVVDALVAPVVKRENGVGPAIVQLPEREGTAPEGGHLQHFRRWWRWWRRCISHVAGAGPAETQSEIATAATLGHGMHV